MTTYTYGTQVSPQCFVEVPDSANPGQTKRPAAGLTVRVRDPYTLNELAPQVTTTYGYLNTWTVDNVAAVQLSADNGTTWIGPILAKESFDQALIAASGRAIASLNGVKADGVTDDRPKLQALINSCYTLGIGIWLGPGVHKMASATATAAGTGYGLVNPGVSIEATPGETTIRAVGITANHMWIGATLSTSAVATCAGVDVTVGTKNYQVDTSAGFGVGDLVTLRMGQNASDIQEAKQAVIATVTAVPDGTHVTLDTAAEFAANVTTQQAKNHQIVKITSLPKDVLIRGIRFEGDASTRHAIGVQWAQHVIIDQCVGYDVGSGLANAQWCDGFKMDNCVIEKCGAYGNTSKGRAVSLSNMRNALVSNLVADYCEGAQVYVESYSTVRFENLHIKNRAATRSQAYNIFAGYESIVDIDSYTHSGSVADSIVSYGAGTGVCNISGATVYGQIGQLRSFPLSTASGLFRIFDNNGIMRVFDLTKIERSQVRIDLPTSGGTPAAKWLRDGLHIGYEVYVSPGVTPDMLTNLGIGRSFVASMVVDWWAAGQMVRRSTFIGGSTFAMQSAHAQGTKVTATVAAGGASIPAGSFVLVTLLSINYEGYATVAGEPGTEQVERFGVGGGGSGGDATTALVAAQAAQAGVNSLDTRVDALEASTGTTGTMEVRVVRRVGGSWVRPTTRTDIVYDFEGPAPSPTIVTSGTAGMYNGDRWSQTAS